MQGSPQRTQAARPGLAAGPPAQDITIDQLSGYQARWRLAARVTKKTSVRQFKYKARDGEGKMFSVDLIDSKGNETRATFFGAAVDSFFDVLQERQMFSFSGGRAKKGDKRYCKFDFEITFDEKATITPLQDDGAVPQMVYEFKNLSNLSEIAPGSTVDVAVIVAQVDPASEIALKAGGTKMRQNVTLLDDSGASCRLTLWGEFCETPWQADSVALLKNVKVSDFGGRSLNTLAGTAVALGDQALASDPRATALSEWYRQQGSAALQAARPLSSGGGAAASAQTIEEMKVDSMDLEATASGVPGQRNQQQKYHTVVPATITFIPHDKAPFYNACPVEVPDEKNEGKMRLCNKKMDDASGGWCCSADHRCQEPKARWIAQFQISDHTGSAYVSSFDEIGQKILGCEASEAAKLFEERNESVGADQWERLFKRSLYKRCRLRLKSRKEVWNDEERTKFSAIDLVPVDFVKEGKAKLAEVLQSLANPAEATAAPGAGL